MKAGLPFISKVLTALAKSVLLPLGLTAAGHAPDVGNKKKYLFRGSNINHVKQRNGRYHEIS